MMILHSRRSAQAMAVALAFLQPCTARAQSPGDSRADQAICSTVARIVLAAKPSGGWRSAWQQPLSVLAKASNGVVSIDAEGWRAKTKEEALDRLRDKYRATPSLTAAVGELIDGGDISTLHRFGSSSLNLAKTVGGTARCENFVFFDAPPAGAAHAVAAPPIVQNAEPFTFCVRTTGYAGEVSGVPAFVVETDQDSTVDLSFTPWRDSGWQRQCKVAIRFSDVFAMTDRFCKDVDCNGLAEQALAITRKVDQSPQATSDDANDQDDKFKALKKLADDRPPDVQLPTFGGQIHGLFGNYDGFAEDSVFLPIIIGGETYLGRVGHGAIGWRKVPDYLFAAYKKVGDSLEPVAGFYISKTRGEPLSATVE